jgi:cysteine desulfurase
MSTLPIYLDNNATTRCDPRVCDALLPFFTQDYGNPASTHHLFGQRAAEAVEQARGLVAALIGAKPREIVFTSGATESIHLALHGVMEAYRPQGNHLIVGATEHQAVLETAAQLEQKGYRVTVLPVDSYGAIDPTDLDRAIGPATVLVSLMAANNEVGTLLPLEQIGTLCQRRGVLFHTDAAQWVGKLPLDVRTLPVDLVSFSAHKMYGPKGVGALFLRRPEVRLVPQLVGGGQERGLRSGTTAVPLIVGFGKACELAQAELPNEIDRLRRLGDRLWQRLRDALDGLSLNGPPTHRLPGNMNIRLEGIHAPSLLARLRTLAISTGSACTSGNGASHVLRAMGLTHEQAQASLRIGLGRFTTEVEIDCAAELLVATIRQQREESPLYELYRHEMSRT